ncbi:MAG: hypothetical protein ACK5XN_08510 [Bacteroidota bacterium]
MDISFVFSSVLPEEYYKNLSFYPSIYNTLDKNKIKYLEFAKNKYLRFIIYNSFFMDTLHQVKLNLSPAQIKKLLKKQVVQIKPNQLNDGITFVSLDKKHYARYRRAKNQKKGMRLQMSDHMINGSGFSDVFKNIKAGAQKVASVAIPYLKDKVKSLLPGVRSDINAVVNPGIDSVASRIKSTLNPLIGDAANE